MDANTTPESRAASKAGNPIREAGKIDRTLKASDAELTQAIVEEREEARGRKIRSIQKTHVLLDQSRTLLNATKVNLSNPIKTVMHLVRDEVLSEKKDAVSMTSSSIASQGDAASGSDSLPEISLEPPSWENLPLLSENYEVMKRFAKGGQGVLAKARDRMLQRIVAVKSLRSEHLDNEEIRRVFVEEALITAQLEHPAIISIYSLMRDEDNGIHLSMKLLHGRTLQDYLDSVQDSYVKGKTNQWEYNARIKENLGVFLKVCEAIAYAHSRGIIHCDLKPENIMLGDFGEVFVLDWGLAKKLSERKDLGDPEHDIKPKLDGTPRFIPPEAYAGVPRDERADIFALGLILFEIATLRCGYEGSSIKEIIRHVRAGERNSVEHRFGFSVSPELAAIIEKATAYDPEERYQSVQELMDDVYRLLNGEETEALPDNYFRYAVRHMRHHLALVFIVALLGWGSVIGFLFLDSLDEVEQQKGRAENFERVNDSQKLDIRDFKYQKMLTEEVNALNDSSYRISEKLRDYTDFLSRLARQSAALLEFSSILKYPTAVKAFHCAELSSHGEVYAPAFCRNVSLEGCSYQMPPNQSQERVREEIACLEPLYEELRELVLFSDFKGMIPPEGAEVDWTELRAKCAQEGMTVFQAYIALEDTHLQICYPGHNSYLPDYDNHTRQWYLAARAMAEKKILKPQWSMPYLDRTHGHYVINCIMPILGENGAFLGTCSLEMLYPVFEKIVLDEREDESFVLGCWVLARDGSLLVCQEENKLLPGQRSEPYRVNYLEKYVQNIPPSIRTIFEDIFFTGEETHFGSRDFLENGCRVTYHYAYVKELDVYLIKKTSRDMMVEKIEESERIQLPVEGILPLLEGVPSEELVTDGPAVPSTEEKPAEETPEAPRENPPEEEDVPQGAGHHNYRKSRDTPDSNRFLMWGRGR